MPSEQKEEKSKLTYDDRRKELLQEKSQLTENKTDPVKDAEGKTTEESKLISTVEQKMSVVYTEEGIRLAYKNLVNERTFLEQRASQLKKQVEEKVELSDELKELKKKLDLIKKSDTDQRAKEEYESILERLNDTKKNIQEIKSTIGDRLKL